VISPQNGHILWDAKSPRRGSIRKNLLSEAANEARRLRTWPRKLGRKEFMDEIGVAQDRAVQTERYRRLKA
jgi:hypothetical protein